MTIFLSLCLACARQHSNGFTPTEILKITKDDIAKIAPLIEVPSHPLQDDIENSKSKKTERSRCTLAETFPHFSRKNPNFSMAKKPSEDSRRAASKATTLAKQ